MVIKDSLSVAHALQAYASPKSKLTRMIASGELIHVRRGLYVQPDGSPVPARSLAGMVYGPSYLSFHFALFAHGLIPEKAVVFTSASFNKNKDKTFETPFGTYVYYYLPVAIYPFGVERREELGMPYELATPEKALCDALYKENGIANESGLEMLLFENWRIDPADFKNLDGSVLRFLAPLYKRKTLYTLHRLLERNPLYA
jgi:hypothetical protein